VKTALHMLTGGIVPSIEAAVDRQESDPNCQALAQCVAARLKRLEDSCTPEQWRLITECQEYQAAHRRELARLCYTQGLHDVRLGPAPRNRTRALTGAEVGQLC
jgi:hypothetical protein